MLLNTVYGRWIVPPLRACWLPAGFDHQVRTRSALEMHSVYVRQTTLFNLPNKCRLLQVPALMRELILWLENHAGNNQTWTRAGMVLFDQIGSEENLMPDNNALTLPSLEGTALSTIENAYAKDPSLKYSLDDWATLLDTSKRTLARRFDQLAGMNFSNYRLQLRLQRAIEMLAEDVSVTQIAYTLNFPSPSAFIGIFRQHTGQTPGRYFKS